MVKYLTDSLRLLCLWVSTIAALKETKHSEQQRAAIDEKAIIPCPILQEVMKKDGAFDTLHWKICVTERCNDKHSRWRWLGGMNHKGETSFAREGIRVTSHGALEIYSAQLNDTGRYMCTVERVDYQSPERHFVTLTVSRVAADKEEKKSTNKTEPVDCKKDNSEDKGDLVYVFIASTCVLSGIFLLALAYKVYMKCTGIRCWNQRNASV